MSESMTAASPADLEKWSARIRALLAKAERTDNEHEAATYRAKAEGLAQKYRLAEEDLIAGDPASLLPEFQQFDLTRYSSPFWRQHVWMWDIAVHHAMCLTKYSWGHDDKRDVVMRAGVVGYASDIRYAIGLYQTAWLTMIANLEPEVDPSLSDEENVYRLRRAGLPRNKIAQLLWGADLGDAGAGMHRRAGNLYKKACEARGENPAVSGKGLNRDAYRAGYADQFAIEFGTRLRQMREGVEVQGGGMVLHGRKERVQAAFYEQYPEEKPKSRDEAAMTTGAVKAPKKVSQAAVKKYERRMSSSSAAAGRIAGHAAAAAMDLGRGSKPTRKVEQGEQVRASDLGIGS